MRELKEMTDEELTIHLNDVVRELKRKVYAEGYDNGYAIAKAEAEIVAPKYGRWAKKSAQEERDRIVERAREDIERLKEYHTRRKQRIYRVKAKYVLNGNGRSDAICAVDFITNTKKRTVVSLLRGVDTGIIYARGIAKCAPNDCFNVHIGKAIALRRALGLEVSDEYLNAPQPAEIRVGDVVETTDKSYPMWGNGRVVLIERPFAARGYFVEDGSYNYLREAKIIDDSRDGKD